MVRLGLGESGSESGSSDDEYMDLGGLTSGRKCSPFAAPAESDDDDDEGGGEQRTPTNRRASYSPGGLFSSGSDGFGREECIPGSRERMGLAAQMGLDPEAVDGWRDALSPRAPEAEEEGDRAMRLVVAVPRAPPAPAPAVAPRPGGGARRAAASRTLRRLAEARVARGLEPRAPSAHASDSGLSMGRGFRAAFSADGRLACPVRDGRGGFRVASRPVSAAASSPAPALAVALAHFVPGDGGGATLPARGLLAAPVDGPRGPRGDALAAAAAAYRGAESGEVASLWRLAGALFAPPAAGDASGMSDEDGGDGGDGARRDAVNDYLADRAEGDARERGALVVAGGAERAPWRSVFAALAAHDVDGAVATCLRAGKTRFALAAAARDDPSVRGALAADADRYRAAAAAPGAGADAALAARCAGALAGDLVLEDDLERAAPEGAAGLGWRQRLGMHCWYGDGDLEDALRDYDGAVAAGCARPPRAVPGGDAGAVAADYALLKVWADPRRGVAGVLDAFAVGRNCGDVAHAWHLALLLGAAGAAPVAETILARLAAALVYELTATGEWHWALFVVAATFADPETRERLARDVLDRHGHGPRSARAGRPDAARAAADAHELKRSFAVAALGCPDAWLESAAATRAGAVGPPGEHAALLIGAKRWADAEAALVRLGPNAVFRGRPSALRPLLERIEPERGAAPGWARGAGALLDYARFRDDLAAVLVALAAGAAVEPDALAALARAADDLAERVRSAGSLDAPPGLAATGGWVRDAPLLSATKQHLATELDDAAKRLRAAAGDDSDRAPAPDVHPDAALDTVAALARALVC